MAGNLLENVVSAKTPSCRGEAEAGEAEGVSVASSSAQLEE